MPRFEFRLQAVLDLRRQQREQRRAQLAAAIDLERQVEQRRRGLEAELDRQRQWVRAGTLPGAIDVERLRIAGQYESSLRAQLEHVAASFEAAAAEIENCQQALATADGEVRTLEKLRDRQRADFQRGRASAQARQMDELASRQHGCPLRSA